MKYRVTGAPSHALLGLILLMFTGPLPAADYFEGKRLYESHCAGCHGIDGNRVMPGAPSFSRGERLTRPDSILFESISNGKNACPGFGGLLQREEIVELIAYIKSFL